MRSGRILKSSWTKSEIRFWRCVHGLSGSPPPRPLLRHLVEEEVREGDAGEGAVVGERAERAVVAGVVPALDVAQELAAELERVAALDPGQLLVELVALRQVVLESGRGADRGEPAAPVDRAQAGDRLPARDPEGRVGVADAAPVVQPVDVVDRVVADEDLVDQRRAEDVAPVGRQVAERRLASSCRGGRGTPSSSLLRSYSAIEKRRKSLSLADAFQSRRRSPWWARVVVRVSPT